MGNLMLPRLNGILRESLSLGIKIAAALVVTPNPHLVVERQLEHIVSTVYQSRFTVGPAPHVAGIGERYCR